MDYNKFTYYRANPYAKQGFLPPTALQNRMKANFPSEVPMGSDPLGRIGKRTYANGPNSHIQI